MLKTVALFAAFIIGGFIFMQWWSFFDMHLVVWGWWNNRSIAFRINARWALLVFCIWCIWFGIKRIRITVSSMTRFT